MKIQEVMNYTGVSKKALQYYEDKHLIHVEKDTNGYRIYDETCINCLWQIKVLRKMDFSIQEIERIIKNEQREDIFKKHFNEVDQRMSQCMIQKDYLEKLYNDFEHVSDPDLLQKLDHEMEEDFKRNKEIVVEIEKHRPYVAQIVFVIEALFIGLLCLFEKTDDKAKLFGLLLIFGAIYKVVELVNKKESTIEMSPLSMMLEDGATKIKAIFERRKNR